MSKFIRSEMLFTKEGLSKLANARVAVFGVGGVGGYIAEALAKQHSIEIDRRKINLQDPIKAFGTYLPEVKLYPEITGKITVVVTDK